VGAIVEYTQQALSGLLYYRRAFPADVRPFVPGTPKQSRKSLGGSSITAPGAMERYQGAAAEYGRLTSIARKAKAGTFDVLELPAPTRPDRTRLHPLCGAYKGVGRASPVSRTAAKG
jgi:hypothetical protein